METDRALLDAPRTQIIIALHDVVRFIGGASPEDFRTIQNVVRFVQRRRQRDMSKNFKPGDIVEWIVEGKIGGDGRKTGQYFKGHVVQVNRTTCSITVRVGTAPLDLQHWRVPFELLRHAE